MYLLGDNCLNLRCLSGADDDGDGIAPYSCFERAVSRDSGKEREGKERKAVR